MGGKTTNKNTPYRVGCTALKRNGSETYLQPSLSYISHTRSLQDVCPWNVSGYSLGRLCQNASHLLVFEIAIYCPLMLLVCGSGGDGGYRLIRTLRHVASFYQSVFYKEKNTGVSLCLEAVVFLKSTNLKFWFSLSTSYLYFFYPTSEGLTTREFLAQY